MSKDQRDMPRRNRESWKKPDATRLPSARGRTRARRAERAAKNAMRGGRA